MSARDELATLLGLARELTADDLDAAADAILAAGFRRPRDAEDLMVEWASYRSAYGSADRDRKVFVAGWEAANGKSFEEGPLR